MQDFDYYLFTDGASSKNPGPGGFGAILISPDKDDFWIDEFAGGEKLTTNNKMELKAVIVGLSKTKSGSRILVFSDSTYVIKGITVWIKKWKNNNWQTSLKKPVENQDLWRELDVIVSQREVSFKYVPGHNGISLNERADELAVSFYTGEKLELFSGLKKDYKIKFELSDFKQFFVASSKSSKKKAPVFSYVSLVDGILAVHKTWPECEKRVKGKKAKYKKVFSREEEDQVRKDWSKQ